MYYFLVRKREKEIEREGERVGKVSDIRAGYWLTNSLMLQLRRNIFKSLVACLLVKEEYTCI